MYANISLYFSLLERLIVYLFAYIILFIAAYFINCSINVMHIQDTMSKKWDTAGSVPEVDKYNKQKECNYFIVEFDDGLQVIPQNWLISEKEAYWPPLKDWKSYYKAVKDMHEPAKDWKTSSIAKIIGSANTFPRAMEKLSMAEKTSDISTDTDSTAAKLKRRKHARKIQSEDDEEESSEDNGKLLINKSLPPLPKPPDSRYGSRKNTNEYFFCKQACGTQSNASHMQKTILKEIGSFVDENISLGSQNSPNEKTILHDSDETDEYRSENENENISPNITSRPHCLKDFIKTKAQESRECPSNKRLKGNTISEKIDIVSDKNCDSCKSVLKLQKEILTLLCENILRSKRCEKMLQNLTEKSTNTNMTSISNIVDNDTDLYPEYLPAQTLADFHLAEDKWKTDKAYRENVVDLFVKCKSSDIKNTTYTIMGKLMTDNVAKHYSWTGAKQNKEKLEESPFRKVLERIIPQLHNEATLHGIKKYITDWLRHAKKRHTRRSSNQAE